MDKLRESITGVGHNICSFYKRVKDKIIKEKDPKVIIICVIALALIIVFLYGNVSSKKRDVIEQLSNSLSKGNERALMNLIEDGTNEERISAFITLYPNSVHVGQAKFFLNIIRGEKNYASGYNYTAYEYYKNADAYKTLTGVPAIHYQELKEARELSEILQSESETKVSAFLQTLPYNSVHRDEVSNRLAILKATNLTLFSSKYSMDDAMSFAKDSQTRAIVKQYIDSVKNMRKSYEKRQRALSRQEWWEERVSVGWNIVRVSDRQDTIHLPLLIEGETG